MKILLAEDTRVMAAVLASRLAACGHEVEVAINGKIALEMFAAASYDLVLMDIEMPEMNGFEATNRIRAIEATCKWAWTPILFLTASDTPENLVTAIEAGGDDFLAKTVPEIVLQAKMKAMSRIATLRRNLSIANRKLEEQASRDGLTGICNRRYMDIRLDAAWVDASGSGKPFGLLMIDIDNFKKYNDHYGHLTGDECLRAIATTLERVVIESNKVETDGKVFVARYGGEEFAVILPDVSEVAFKEIANALVEAISQQGIEHVMNKPWGLATISVGGDFLAVTTGKIADMFQRADRRLYQAKESGRNRAVV